MYLSHDVIYVEKERTLLYADSQFGDVSKTTLTSFSVILFFRQKRDDARHHRNYDDTPGWEDYHETANLTQ